MRVKAFIRYKGIFKLTYIGKLSKNGVFHFRNKQMRKACLNSLKQLFDYNCNGGSLTIPNLDRESIKRRYKIDKYVICYNCVIPEKENNKYIVTYLKS